MSIFMSIQMKLIEFLLIQLINLKDLRKPTKNSMQCMNHLRRQIDNQLNTELQFQLLMEKIYMKHGGILKNQSRNLTEYSTELRNSIQENLQIQKITTEENKECLKERDKDGLKTILISLADLLKMNKCIETTSNLILKEILKMISLKRNQMNMLLLQLVISNSRDLTLWRQVCNQNLMKHLMMLSSKKYSSTNTDWLMMEKKNTLKDKEEYFKDLSKEQRPEIQHLNKISLISTKKM